MPRGKTAGASPNAPKTETGPVPLQSNPLVQQSTGGKSVPVGKVAPNPRNLRGGDLWESPEEKQETVTSIREVGLIQALVVCTRVAFTDRYPEYEDELGDARYVLMAGHRRLDAVLAAGLETVRVDVQDDLVPKLNMVMLEENLKRKTLDAFQEGEGYRRANVEDELSYQQIAEKTGKSKSHITKRVKLLDLSRESRALVTSRRISIDNAYGLLTALGPANEHRFTAAFEAMSEGRLTPKEAANTVLAVSARNSSPKPPAAPAEPTEPFLTETAGTDSAVEADSEAAPTIPSARSQDPFLTETDTSDPSPETETPEPGSPEAGADDALDRSAASAHRDECCAQLVASYEPATSEPQTLRTAATTLALASTNALARAHTWMRSADARNAAAMTPGSYRDSILLSGEPQLAIRFAYAVALAEGELRASDRRRRWDHRDIAHLQHLIDTASYTPTSWEKHQLP